MRAIRVYEFGAPEVMRFEEVPDLVPQAGQVGVKIHAAGVNPVETYIRSGNYPVKFTLPYTPGTDGAGVVTAVGSRVRRVKPGDRVYTAGTLTGTYAETALCEESQVHPLPDGVNFAQGAAVNIPYATAYRALFDRARVKKGETVLVHGASGGVGIASLQLARAAGLTVIATAGTERGRALVLREGAHYVFDHHSPDHPQKILDVTGGQGVNVVLEMLANVNLGRDLEILSKYGRVVVIGCRGGVEINPRDLMSRDADVLGLVVMNMLPEELSRVHAALGEGLTGGTLCPVVGREFRLEEAGRAHHEIMETPAYGKIVLLP